MKAFLVLLSAVIVANLDAASINTSGSDFALGDPRLCLITDRRNNFQVQPFEVLPGEGWDNLQNKPKGQVIQFNYTKCLTTEDGRFLVPDQVFTIAIKESTLNTFAELIDSWHNTSSVTSDSVNVNAGLNVFGIAAGGSFSWDHTQIKKKQIEDKAVTARVQLRYIRYKSMLQPDSQLHPNFKTRLLFIAASLQLNQTKMAKYEAQLLVRDYGTHVLTNVVAGAGLVKTDFLKRSYVASQSEDKTNILASAHASFGSFFHMSASGSHSSDTTDLKQYLKSMTHSYVKNYGGPLLDPVNPNVSVWTANVDKDLVAMDRGGDPLSYLITEEAFPELPVYLVFQLEKVVRKAILHYYKVNTHRGCTKLGSPNFSFSANFDDGTCEKKATNMTFGGVFQTCQVEGQFINNNPCAGMTQMNPKTRDYSCPSQYKAVELVTSTKIGAPETRRDCHSCWLFFDCCNTKTFQATAKYTTFWCAADNHVEQDSGYLFGGLYSKTQENPLTNSKGCPPSFYALQFIDRQICISDDFEVGRQYSAPLGGFFSCNTGNPLAVPGVKPVGLKASPNSLRVFMSSHHQKGDWPKHCPEGYSQHLAVIDSDCEVNYCLKSGMLSGPNLPSIKLPPFSDVPIIIPSQTIETIFDPRSQEWLEEIPATTTNPQSAAISGQGSNNGAMQPGTAAAIGVISTLMVVVVICVGLVFHRRRQNATQDTQMLLPGAEESVHGQIDNSGNYGATDSSSETVA